PAPLATQAPCPLSTVLPTHRQAPPTNFLPPVQTDSFVSWATQTCWSFSAEPGGHPPLFFALRTCPLPQLATQTPLAFSSLPGGQPPCFPLSTWKPASHSTFAALSLHPALPLPPAPLATQAPCPLSTVLPTHRQAPPTNFMPPVQTDSFVSCGTQTCWALEARRVGEGRSCVWVCESPWPQLLRQPLAECSVLPRR